MVMSSTGKLDTVSFGAKGQVVIPRRLRKEFEIEKGTKATVVSTPEGILLKPITRTYIKSLRGKYKHLPLMETLGQMKDEEKHR
ncbi:MAG: Looped-hinge helix binding protein AbrB family [Pedosphaera sp.]|nr:Looped-hinge helix binding protein AbrB family [Pedosphaera sp.]